MLLAGVDHFIVFVAGRGRRPHAKQAVLALQENLAVGRQMIADQRGEADAEIDIRAFRNILS